jgi:NAD(P)-dependent dehydrogenase (short-subunit alcohol dehydrogenase family)
MMASVDGLKVLVTGAASGIGEAIAAKFAACGASVVGLDRVRGASRPLVTPVVADLSDDVSVRAAVAEAGVVLGGLDVVINNAGIGATGSIEENSDDEWHKVFDVNVLGLVRVTRAALPLLRASDHASIVNIASIVSDMGLPLRALYTASKGAVTSLTRAMAADCLADGIRVNAVHPGTADTPWIGRLLDAADDAETARSALAARQPHGRLVSADEVASAVVYLAGRASGSTNGSILTVDGGLTAMRAPTS